MLLGPKECSSGQCHPTRLNLDEWCAYLTNKLRYHIVSLTALEMEFALQVALVTLGYNDVLTFMNRRYSALTSVKYCVDFIYLFGHKRWSLASGFYLKLCALLCTVSYTRPDPGFVKRGGRVPVKRGRVANIAPKSAEFAWFSCQKGGPVPIRPIPGSAPDILGTFVIKWTFICKKSKPPKLL